jgi:hypothetical protein
MFHRLRDHFLRDRLINRTNILFRGIILFTTPPRGLVEPNFSTRVVHFISLHFCRSFVS